MGLKRLRDRFMDLSFGPSFAGVFPKDNPKNTRFAINFFTSIGLGALTDDLRQHLKNAPKMIKAAAAANYDSSGSSGSGSSSSGSDSDSDSDSSSSSGSSGSSGSS